MARKNASPKKAAKAPSPKKVTAGKKPAPKSNEPVDSAEVRMYRIGTGDCFVVKFFAGKTPTFTIMIDCGAWQGTKEVFARHVRDLKTYVDGRVDVLVVTHEHKDHVLGFEQCEALFTQNFEVGQIWMAWTEKDGDSDVETWKKQDGARKKALAAAASEFTKAVKGPEFTREMRSLHRGNEMLQAHHHFAGVLDGFAELHMAVNQKGEYVGPLAGMKVVKEEIAKNNIKYFKPGDVIEDVPGLGGVRIFVLGPPQDINAIHTEDSGEEGETYAHNKELAKSDAFALAVNALEHPNTLRALLPFAKKFEASSGAPVRRAYQDAQNGWRRIDQDWLMSAGSLAMRLNTGINNLSLALAIEFGSGRVMLFPGDAEYGSWDSWHRVPWKEKGKDKTADGKPKHLTEDLLNRTVFYKVAHHLSHNGTARHKGMDMMTSKDLAAMATLDYNVISPSWKGTMPNQGLLEDLISRTRGKLMVLRPDGVFFDARKTIRLEDKITQGREEMTASQATEFKAAHQQTDLFIQYRVKG